MNGTDRATEVGPADAVKPCGGVEVTLYFPYPQEKHTCVLPAVPHEGDLFNWDMPLGSDDGMDATWEVVRVTWRMDEEGATGVGVSLSPHDEATELVTRRLARVEEASSRPPRTAWLTKEEYEEKLNRLQAELDAASAALHEARDRYVKAEGDLMDLDEEYTEYLDRRQQHDAARATET